MWSRDGSIGIGSDQKGAIKNGAVARIVAAK
jgi:hypothetical protein